MSDDLKQKLHDLSISAWSTTPLIAIARIEELETELAGAINVAYGVSEAAGKRRGELEAKLAVVEKERDDLRYLAKAETREDAEAFRNNAMNQIDRCWEIDRVKDAMGIIRTEGAISKIKGEQP